MTSESQKPRLRLDRVVGAGLILTLAAALAFSEFGRFRQGELLTKEVKAAKADAQAALSAVIPTESVARLEDSVYLIKIEAPEYRSSGTAFVIAADPKDPHRVLMATAAHITEDIVFYDDKITNFVVNRYSKKPMRIVAAKTHSGFGALEDVVEAYQPYDLLTRRESIGPVLISDTAFDVGFLIVDTLDEETGEDIPVGPPLPIASQDDLMALAAGEPIAIVSYPADAIDSAAESRDTGSRTERSVVAAVRAPIDSAEGDSDPRFRTIVAHRMTTTGGSSGAPLINRKGEVIGVHVAGNGVDSAATRADLIYDLLNPLQDARSISEIHIPEWMRRLARWPKAEDAIPYLLYKQASDPVWDGEPGNVNFAVPAPYIKTVEQKEFASAIVDRYAVPFSNKSPTAPSDLRSELSGFAPEDNRVFILRGAGQYAVQKLQLPEGKRNIVFAFDYAFNLAEGACAMALYYRKQSSDTFTRVGRVMAPHIELPGGAYEFVYFRPGNRLGSEWRRCSDNNKFMTGIVSWPDEQKTADVSPTRAAWRPRQLPRRVVEAADKIRNVADCRLIFWDRDRCITSVHAEYLGSDEPAPAEEH